MLWHSYFTGAESPIGFMSADLFVFIHTNTSGRSVCMSYGRNLGHTYCVLPLEQRGRSTCTQVRTCVPTRCRADHAPQAFPVHTWRGEARLGSVSSLIASRNISLPGVESRIAGEMRGGYNEQSAARMAGGHSGRSQDAATLETVVVRSSLPRTRPLASPAG
jgi:hypothetical protein